MLTLPPFDAFTSPHSNSSSGEPDKRRLRPLIASTYLVLHPNFPHSWPLPKYRRLRPVKAPFA